MSGTSTLAHGRRARRGAALTLVFVAVLGTGAAAGSWGTELGTSARSQAPGAGPLDTRPAAAAHGRGEGGTDAEDLVSRSGDRWSAAYTAREYEGLQERMRGTYVGVGLSVRQVPHDAGVEIAAVTPGSPADEAGLRPGRRLHAVDGAETSGLPVTDVVRLLRGSPAGEGSTVTLDLGPAEHLERVTLRRVRLSTGAVSVDRVAPGVTRVRLTSFTDGSGEQVRRAVARAPEGDGLLLDLRGNSGGLVTEAASAASAFLDGGLVATYDDSGTRRALYADGGDASEAPLVVLVDGGTMSAAELLTGALQDRGRAVVVGSRTFGKGTVQRPVTLGDGSVAELTVGSYRTPAGRTVAERGLTPDLAVGPGEDAVDEARTVLGGLTPGS